MRLSQRAKSLADLYRFEKDAHASEEITAGLCQSVIMYAVKNQQKTRDVKRRGNGVLSHRKSIAFQTRHAVNPGTLCYQARPQM